jgi:hypothetical protein
MFEPPDQIVSTKEQEPGSRMPTLPTTEKIESALRSLDRGDTLFVDVTGAVHNDKRQFLNGTADPLVSFKRPFDDRGVFIVHSGLPPRNQTFCAPSRTEGQSRNSGAKAEPLKYSTTLNSGAILLLGSECEVTIPKREVLDPKTPEEKLSALLAGAKVGETVELGRRAVAECDRKVSRVHCTIEVLKSDKFDDGALSLQIKVTPGMPSKGVVQIEHLVGRREKIHGQVEAASGAAVFLGDSIGTVKIPHIPGSIGDASLSISQMLSEGLVLDAKKVLGTFVGEHESTEHSLNLRDFERLAPHGVEIVLKANVLQNQISQALSLIREGKYSEAIEHLRDPHTLEMLGYTFAENHCFGLTEITHEAIIKNLKKISRDSWFKIDQKQVYPSFGVLHPGLAPQNQEEHELLNHWHKEVALVYAEEYTHALQDLLGGCVSRKAALLSTPDHEADVALFFHEQGVKLSYDFVKNRYSERGDALELANGFQSAQQQEIFTKALADMPLGALLYVGRDTDKNNQKYNFSISQYKHEADDQIFAGKCRHALRQLEEVELTIRKNSDGSFDVAPFADKAATLFVPDASGYYYRATKPVTLEPGTPIYIGRAFKFVLS